jgi:hypothetical protein
MPLSLPNNHVSSRVSFIQFRLPLLTDVLTTTVTSEAVYCFHYTNIR